MQGVLQGCHQEPGHIKVITNLCVMGFDEETKRMKVETIHPGVTKEEIIENTGSELLWADEIKVSLEPTEEELRILREGSRSLEVYYW